ncbi:MAG: hypothetical protein A2Y62_18725 [Candidatus Fischerbacteria bacterium RBG_13_37_8]|uniref:HD-GYP domain-containing protein n=1 Tax=Candidatus Fischerbacteria bacterium RBG_13_37_8 TaxID=1817863 RepID=A0A1F5VQ60_9BACT|nr:MAG: hypothetical protein A2Y62_18725 [Candidatus Fischerbacteria bacterium RBG_13_37_8]
MAKKIRLSILHYLLIILTLISIIPLTITVYKMTNTYKQHILNKELELQFSILDNVASSINYYLTSHRNRLNDLASSLRIAGIYDTEKLNIFLKNIAQEQFLNELLKNGQWTSVIFFNNNAEGIRAGENIGDATLQQLMQNAFVLATRGTDYISDPYLTRSANGKILPLLVLGIPLTDSNRTPIGAIIVTLNMQPILNTIIGKTMEGRRVFVVDDKGFLFLDADEEALLQHKSMANNELVKDFRTKGGRLSNVMKYEDTIGGKKVEMLGSYKAVPDYNWGVFAQIETSLALADIQRTVNTAMKWVAISALIALLLAVFFARETSSPIRSLAGFAMSMAKERNFNKKIDVRSTYEIEQLATTFNLMTDEISNYILSLKKAAEENRQLFLNGIKMLVAAIDAKDPYTKGHSERVMAISSIIARYLNFTQVEIDKIEISALLHDVGKIGIDDRILQKPEALNEEEYEIMKTHPEKGAKIMSQIPQLKEMLAGMHYHHEFWDGSGYPLKLKGETIPIIARIIGLADTFDAMTTERPYQAAMKQEKAVERIMQFSNTRFDPKVVKAFVNAYQHGEFGNILKNSLAQKT